jgi:hypothetical protein
VRVSSRTINGCIEKPKRLLLDHQNVDHRTLPVPIGVRQIATAVEPWMRVDEALCAVSVANQRAAAGRAPTALTRLKRPRLSSWKTAVSPGNRRPSATATSSTSSLDSRRAANSTGLPSSASIESSVEAGAPGLKIRAFHEWVATSGGLMICLLTLVILTVTISCATAGTDHATTMMASTPKRIVRFMFCLLSMV